MGITEIAIQVFGWGIGIGGVVVIVAGILSTLPGRGSSR